MVGRLQAAALLALMTAVAACGKRPEADAAGAIHALLTAAQARDLQTFEQHLDRPAIRADLREQLVGVARANGLDVGGPSDFALDRMIGPEAFKLVHADTGAPLAAAPSADQIAALVKPLDRTRVCLHDLTPQKRCVLTFVREKPGWRLVSMPAADLRIEVAPEPPRKG